MHIVEQPASLLWVTPDPCTALERAARTCYKPEDKITVGSASKMVASLIKSGHHAMLEHACASVHVVTDRGVSHEIVRHRIASYAQESTRFVDYAKGKYDREISVVKPLGMSEDQFADWQTACLVAEKYYFRLRDLGAPPEVARDVLPTCLKTELVITMNFRERRHFFSLRRNGTTGKPHPKMRVLADLIFKSFTDFSARPVFEDPNIDISSFLPFPKVAL